MRLKILILIAAGLVFFSSCAKEEVDPVLEIFVTTIASDNWEQVDMFVGDVRFTMESEDGGEVKGSLQQYFGGPLEASLEQDNSALIFNDRHFDMKNLKGLRLIMSNILLSNADAGVAKVNQPGFSYIPLDQPISVENGKSYKVEFIIDFDESIYEEDGEYNLDNNYKVEVTEL